MVTGRVAVAACAESMAWFSVTGRVAVAACEESVKWLSATGRVILAALVESIAFPPFPDVAVTADTRWKLVPEPTPVLKVLFANAW